MKIVAECFGDFEFEAQRIKYTSCECSCYYTSVLSLTGPAFNIRMATHIGHNANGGSFHFLSQMCFKQRNSFLNHIMLRLTLSALRCCAFHHAHVYCLLNNINIRKHWPPAEHPEMFSFHLIHFLTVPLSSSPQVCKSSCMNIAHLLT